MVVVARAGVFLAVEARAEVFLVVAARVAVFRVFFGSVVGCPSFLDAVLFFADVVARCLVFVSVTTGSTSAAAAAVFLRVARRVVFSSCWGFAPVLRCSARKSV